MPLWEKTTRARNFLLSFQSLLPHPVQPSFSRESDGQIVRGLDIESHPVTIILWGVEQSRVLAKVQPPKFEPAARRFPT